MEDAKAFLADHPGNNLTVVTDTDSKDFNVEGMHSTYVIDRNGIIRQIHAGFRSENASKLRLLVDQLLTESSSRH